MPFHKSTVLCFALALLPATAMANSYPHCARIKEMATTSSTSLSGRIATIETIDACGKSRQLVTLTLKSKEAVETEKKSRIYLAPNSYLMRNKLHFAIGDDVELVVLPFVADDGSQQFTALEVSKGSQHLKLRDSQGRPLWTGKHSVKDVAH